MHRRILSATLASALLFAPTLAFGQAGQEGELEDTQGLGQGGAGQEGSGQGVEQQREGIEQQREGLEQQREGLDRQLEGIEQGQEGVEAEPGMGEQDSPAAPGGTEPHDHQESPGGAGGF